MKVHVGQCREGERVGGGEGGTQGRRGAANVVDNRGSRGFSFLLRASLQRMRVGRHQVSILPEGPVLCTISECPQGCRLGL